MIAIQRCDTKRVTDKYVIENIEVVSPAGFEPATY